jgi:hypothetical protein
MALKVEKVTSLGQIGNLGRTLVDAEGATYQRIMGQALDSAQHYAEGDKRALLLGLMEMRKQLDNEINKLTAELPLDRLLDPEPIDGP